MENKIVHKGKVIWLETKAMKNLYLDMPRKPEEAHLSFPLQGALGLLTVEEVFKPYLGKNISIIVERKEGKVHHITIQEE
jgi:hypothetical protein